MKRKVYNVMMGLVVAMAFGMAGCGGSDSTDSSAKATDYYALGTNGFKGPYSTLADCQAWVATQKTGNFVNATCNQEGW